MSPVTLIFIIAVILVVLGMVIYGLQRFTVFRGYREIAEDLQRIATVLKADIVRHSGDLVIAGSHRKFPTIVRLSHSQSMPGLHIEMRASTGLEFSLVPKKVAGAAGKMAMRIGSDTLDVKFTARTNDPMQTRMLVSSKHVMANLEKLCCSTQTEFAVKPGTLELSELVIPA